MWSDCCFLNLDMKRLLVCLTLMTLGLCQAEVPKLFTKRAFNSSGLAEAANHFIAIGEAATIEELEKVCLLYTSRCV